MHTEQSTVGSGCGTRWVLKSHDKCTLMSHRNIRNPRGLTRSCSGVLRSLANELVPDFRVLSPRLAELLPLWYPDWRHFNQGGEGRSGELIRRHSDVPSRGSFPLLTVAELFVAEPSVRGLTHCSRVKVWVTNFGRVVSVWLRPPYFICKVVYRNMWVGRRVTSPACVG